MIKVISFDLDGTLAEEEFDTIIWFEEIPKLYAKKYKIPIKKAKKFVFAEYNKFRHDHRWTDVGFWFEHFELENWQKLLDDLKHKIRLFPDTIPVLKELNKKYELIIITSSEKKFLELKLDAENLRNYFEYIFSMPTDFRQLRKDETVYLKILDKLKIKPDEIIHIGDNEGFDYKAPKKVGIKAYILDRKKERKGSHVIHDLYQLKEKLL